MTEYANELAMPVRGGWTGDPTIDAKLKRNFRALEQWAGSPHRVYGSRMISPQYFFTDETNHNFMSHDVSGAWIGIGSDIHVAVELEIDRRQRAFIVGAAEVDNTSGTDYDVYFYLPVDVGGTQNNGKVLRQRLKSGTPGRTQVFNLRDAFIDVQTKTTVKFEWAWKQNSGAPHDMTVYRQKMMLALYDAPDLPANGEIRWTRSIVNRAAYRVAEGNDV
jgi:hypothetical protein